MNKQSNHSDELLAGAVVFEKLYGKTQLQLKRAWLAIFSLLGVLAVLVIFLFILGTEGKVDPIIVKVDGNNQILDVEQASHIDYHSLQPAVATHFIEQFVIHARSVSIDGQWQGAMMKQAYAVTQGAAYKMLHDFYTTRNPFNEANQAIVSVAIDSVLPNIGGSKHTTQVVWTETLRAPKTGKVLGSHQYTGQFTFHWGKPASEHSVVQYNPLGFYITALSWSANYSDASLS